MRNLVLFLHTSLDGFVAGSKGEMDWITVNEAVFEYATQQTDRSDTALYGRITYQMMEAYWPTAGDQPNATKHDTEHSQWYNQVAKVVVSRTMRGTSLPNTQIISENLVDEITKLKQGSGRDIVIFGSPTTAHAFMDHNLIDDYWLFINPVLLGHGIPLFKGIESKKMLALISCDIVSPGIVCMHYKSKSEHQAHAGG